MKTRNGLVSNSSSSSFIVAYKPEEKCKCCGRGNPDLIQIIEQKATANDDYQVYATDKLNIINSLKVHYYEKKDIIDKINKIDDDLTIVYFRISHHDTDLIDRIETMGTIIFSGEG
jgi:hypothetical protein